MTDTTTGSTMTSTPVAPQQESAATTDGRGPTGMWWVAWRQQRFAILAALALMAIAVAALITFRLSFAARIQTWGGTAFYEHCRSGAEDTVRRCSGLMGDLFPLDEWWTTIRVGLIGLPGVVGVLTGAVVFSREQERGTHVYAFTQSVSRSRWYWTKCTVLILPLTTGMMVVGLLTEWAADVYGPCAWDPLETPAFQLYGVVPACLTILVLGVSLAAGAFVKSALPAVVLALALSTCAAGGVGYLGYLDIPFSDRVVGAPLEDTQARIPAGAIALDEGFFGADGEPRPGGPCPDGLGDPGDNNSYAQCLESLGITGRYTDYVYGSRLTPTLAVISLLLAGAFLTAGSIRIRRRST